MEAPAEDGSGLYCSTAGTYFESREDLTDHQKSDFHRYNLKRKIAGLPPVTREWYEARKAQLLASAATPVQRVWFDPLTRRKFYSENTYLAFSRSKKYQTLVKKSGEPAPAPIVTLRKIDEAPAAAAAAAAQQQQAAAGAKASPGFTMKPAVKSAGGAARTAAAEVEDEEDEEDVDEGSDWETASEEEMQTDEKWEEWDVRRCLFDNKMSGSMEENLEYMFKNFGFYFPDSEYLSDPEGLLKYLGAKLQYGHVPLYESGNNPNAKQFHSLHAVQRHMVDTNQCKLAYDDNEEEYEEFYDYGDEEEMAQAGALVLSAAEAGPSASYELVLAGSGGGSGGGGGGGGGKILGSREFARYYRQRPRLTDGRASVQAAQVQAQYRRLAVPLLEGGGTEAMVEQQRRKKFQNKSERLRLRINLSYDKIHNLPKNVTY